MRGISCFFLRDGVSRWFACGVGFWKLREHDLKLPVDAHPCIAYRLAEAAYTAICIAYMVSAAPP